MTNDRFARVRWASFPLIFLFFMALPLGLGAQTLNVDEEFAFASGLVEIGFPDFADKVVQQVLRFHPDQKERALLIQAEILVSKRQFGAAEDLVKQMDARSPKAQAISLAVGKGYYVAGQMDKAREVYNKFFEQYAGQVPADTDLLRFYRDAAFQFGQMLEQANDLEGAVKAYDLYLATKPDPNVARALMARQAESHVKLAQEGPAADREKHLAAAEKLSTDLQWGGMDLWFGQSLITSAHAKMVRGKPEEAQKFLMQNMDIFKEIDEFLKTSDTPMSLSPMAGARFLLGELIQKDAEALAKAPGKEAEAVQAYGRAINEFINVFAKYSASDWGPMAGVRAQEIKTLLKDQYGREVKWDLGEHAADVTAAQFKLADNLFRQGKHAEAVAEYLKTLNQFPEGVPSMRALGNVLISYVQQNDTLYVKMVAAYLAERFAGKNDAAIALLQAGKEYFDRKDEAMYNLMYETYLKGFPAHERAAAILFTLAGLRKQAGDEAGAAKYFERIVDHYPKDQYYPRALSAMAWGNYMSSNYAGAVKGFELYLANAQPSPDKAQAQFALAESQRMTGAWDKALEEYGKLISWIAPRNNPYATSAEDAKKNMELLEKAVYQRAFAYTRINEPAEKTPDYRKSGIQAVDQFLVSFPASTLAPKAMDLKGRIQLELGQFDAAAKTFDELAAKHPTTDEGRNALFSLLRSAMEVKQYEQAMAAFDRMMNTPDKFGPEEFARVGQLMLEAERYEQAMAAYKAVTERTEERGLLERALFGLGRAQYEQGQYAAAVAAMEDLMAKYPKSGTFFEAKFVLASAYKKQEKYKEAQAALGDIMKFAEETVLRNKTSFELGLIQKQQGDKTSALASFLRVALLADANHPQLAPLVEQSLLESIEIGMELQKYDDVLDSCDQYMRVFPRGAKLEDVRNAQRDARMKAAEAAAAAAAAAARPAPAAK